MRGPLDDLIMEEEINEAIKSLKINKFSFGTVSNEIIKCNLTPF